MEHTDRLCQEIICPNGLIAYHRGPEHTAGPLPTLIYFSLSGYESLTLDPYCQPADYWMASHQARAISFDLPEHPKGGKHLHAIERWTQKICVEQQPIIPDFVQAVVESIDFLINNHWIDPQKLSIAGLSRGAFLATHVAVREPRIKTILGYAPLTTFETIKEFEPYLEQPQIKALALTHVADQLVDRQVRFYIGNRDHRVSTRQAFHFIEVLANAAYHQGIRSAQAELIIYPSIGHKGHGTPPHIFKDGIQWMLKM